MNRTIKLHEIYVVIRYCSTTKLTNVKPLVELVEKKRLVPLTAIKCNIHKNKPPPMTKIDEETIILLERLSLINCANKKGIETLEAAIAFADQIQQVDTTGVEPLITVLEDKPLRVRKDEVTEGNCRDEVLSNATLLQDEYFTAPPGNIPLEPRKDVLHEEQN